MPIGEIDLLHAAIAAARVAYEKPVAKDIEGGAMTLEEAQAAGEELLRRAGYTGPVNWSDGVTCRIVSSEYKIFVILDAFAPVYLPTVVVLPTTAERGHEGVRARDAALLTEAIHGDKRLDYCADDDGWKLMSDAQLQEALDDCIDEMFAMQNGIRMAATELARRGSEEGTRC